jgi:hypothetical protein
MAVSEKDEKSAIREVTEVFTEANRELRGVASEVKGVGQDLKRSMQELCDDFNRCTGTPQIRRKRGWLW